MKFCRDGTRNTSTSHVLLRESYGRGGLEATAAQTVDDAVLRGVASGCFPPPVPSEEAQESRGEVCRRIAPAARPCILCSDIVSVKLSLFLPACFCRLPRQTSRSRGDVPGAVCFHRRYVYSLRKVQRKSEFDSENPDAQTLCRKARCPPPSESQPSLPRMLPTKSLLPLGLYAATKFDRS